MDQELFLSIEEKSQQSSCVLDIYICQAVNLYQVEEHICELSYKYM